MQIGLNLLSQAIDILVGNETPNHISNAIRPALVYLKGCSTTTPPHYKKLIRPLALPFSPKKIEVTNNHYFFFDNNQLTIYDRNEQKELASFPCEDFWLTDTSILAIKKSFFDDKERKIQIPVYSLMKININTLEFVFFPLPIPARDDYSFYCKKNLLFIASNNSFEVWNITSFIRIFYRANINGDETFLDGSILGLYSNGQLEIIELHENNYKQITTVELDRCPKNIYIQNGHLFLNMGETLLVLGDKFYDLMTTSYDFSDYFLYLKLEKNNRIYKFNPETAEFTFIGISTLKPSVIIKKSNYVIEQGEKVILLYSKKGGLIQSYTYEEKIENIWIEDEFLFVSLKNEITHVYSMHSKMLLASFPGTLCQHRSKLIHQGHFCLFQKSTNTLHDINFIETCVLISDQVQQIAKTSFSVSQKKDL